MAETKAKIKHPPPKPGRKPSGKRGPNKSKEHHGKAVLAVVNALTAGMSASQAKRCPEMKALGVRADKASKYVNAAYDLLAESGTTIENTRAHMVEMIHHHIGVAAGQKFQWTDKKTGELRSRDQPNSNAVARLLEVLARVQGVDQPAAKPTTPVVSENAYQLVQNIYYGGVPAAALQSTTALPAALPTATQSTVIDVQTETEPTKVPKAG